MLPICKTYIQINAGFPELFPYLLHPEETALLNRALGDIMSMFFSRQRVRINKKIRQISIWIASPDDKTEVNEAIFINTKVWPNIPVYYDLSGFLVADKNQRAAMTIEILYLAMVQLFAEMKMVDEEFVSAFQEICGELGITKEYHWERY